MAMREAAVRPVSFADPDAVLGPAAVAVPQLQVGQLAAEGVCGERGHPHAVDIGEPGQVLQPASSTR